MTRRPAWKKAEAERIVRAIADELAKAFNVPAPVCAVPDHREAHDWAWGFETVEVWTKAGRAECNVSISAHFAHLYFRFADPARASRDLFHGYQDGGRLNPHSGKWNSWEAPPASLTHWAEEIAHDFRRVAEPNPPAEEVAAYRAAEAAKAAQWEAWMQQEGIA